MFGRVKGLSIVAACVAAILPSIAPASEELTIERIVAPRPAMGLPPRGFVWAPNGRRYVYQVPAPLENAAPQLRVYDASGSDLALRAASAQARGTRSRPIDQIVWSPDSARLAYIDGGALRLATWRGVDLGRFARVADDPQWSPDGTRIAFANGGGLQLVDLRTRAVRTVARPASADAIVGDPDWLYSEELDLAHAFAWSPRGDALAYLRFDESHVTAFPIQDFLVPDIRVEFQRYPLAGEANPRVSLHVVELPSGRDRTLYDAAARDEYLVNFAWRPSGTAIVAQVLDRAQRHLALRSFASDGSLGRTILRESDSRFVDASPAPVFLADGRRFLWISERERTRSLYVVDADTSAVRRLTHAFPVAALLALDAKHGVAFVDARYPTRRDRALIAVSLAGAPMRVITPEAGTHAIAMSPRGERFVDTFSTVSQPPGVERGATSGPGRSVIFVTPSLDRFGLGT
ncbi:MAG: DPP IV N-terminal domain-containing protein, partial [Candidatus Eremiobacteraeota bacterium]|nr:DPP IV N-terminal domain-containing protein [Candidatus Eremiobacteraeota bacterium]